MAFRLSFAALLFSVAIGLSCSSNNSHEYKDKDNNQYQSKEENIETSVEYEIQYDYVQCPLCYGSGICGGCAGRRQVYISGEFVDCTSCNTSGRCGLCEGNGSIKQVRGFH